MSTKSCRSAARSSAALIFLFAAACGDLSTRPAPEAQGGTVSLSSALSGSAQLSLASSSTRVTLTTNAEWSLSKTGSLSGNTVTWNITATKTATTSGQLRIDGEMTVVNSGTGAATIGNIVVNLQKRVNNKWVTVSSNVANATQGDAATTANIHAAASSENKSAFTENSASGSLNFMDATSSTVFALVPQVMIDAGATKPLLFSASFDNNDPLLGLAPGTPIRAEVIVTFGNATPNGNSTPNVDINGNSTLDADEDRVRSVALRPGLTVPASVDGSGPVTLSDAPSDISATGDVTFSNVVITLGATSGTVTTTVFGGANGGTITNCAHLTSAGQSVGVGGVTFPIVDGVDLQSCSTVDVAATPPTCTPGAPGCGWKAGEMRTANQSGWETGTPASLFVANFSSLYSGGLVVGGTRTMTFTNATAVATYLPSAGSPNSLNATVINPMTTSSGELGGQVVALQLNTDLSSPFGNDVDFGSLRICGFAPAPAVNDMTVDEFLASANWLLGGGSAAFGFSTALAVANLLNNAFVDGAPSSFAQANLVAASSCAGTPPTCTPGAPGCGWKAGEMRTANQGGWETGTPASTLTANFTSLYGSAVVVGGNFTMTFTTPIAVFTYLPAVGTPAALNANLTNPQTSSSGELGGQVLALQLNSDLSTALGNDVSLGSIRICGLAAVPAVNGMTIDEFLASANLVLGGGSATFGANAALAVATLLNNAFVDGAPSAFAQANLFAASTCPSN